MNRILGGLLMLVSPAAFAVAIPTECFQDSDCTPLCAEKLATLVPSLDGGLLPDGGPGPDAGIIGVKCSQNCRCAIQIDGVCSATAATFMSSAPTVTGACVAESLFTAQGPGSTPAPRGGCSTSGPQLSVIAGAMMAFALWRKRKKR